MRTFSIKPEASRSSGVKQDDHPQQPPLSLYVHVPWCVRKCPYCDFNSHELRSGISEEDYLDALLLDLEGALPLIWGRPVTSIFFGGGTPSLLSPECIDRLLSALRARINLQAGAEITLEANPGTFDNGRFAGFRDAGITRLSIGIQSFDERLLLALGRIHDAALARAAAASARQLFETFNLDLMYGLPGQSIQDVETDLSTALEYQPNHLSCYQLTLEPNTKFASFPPDDLPDEDMCGDMQEIVESTLAVAGFRHYETSAFAKPEHMCRHNLNYWHFGDYLGIGPGAHSKLTMQGRIVRQMRWKHPEAWQENVRRHQPVQTEHEVTRDALPVEFLMNALRLNDGFPLDMFSSRTGLPVRIIQPRLEQAVGDGLLTVHQGVIAPTVLGRRFLNRLIQIFMASNS